jgi:hypothetical protein|tara:strand:- start:5 stop:388 length:384 start_codon:yes stop_codon:yes gene_type:complete
MTTFTTDKATMTKSSVNNNNILIGDNVMPMKGQTSSGGGTFSLMRQIYQRTPKEDVANHNNQHKGKQESVYQDNSLYLLKKKARAMGKQSYSSPLSFNSNLIQDVKSAKKRVRSSGAVAPTKKGVVI